MTIRASLLVLTFALAFSACAARIDDPPPRGGDGGSNGGGGDESACEGLTLSEEEQRVYDRMMEERAEVGLPSVPPSAALFAVARAHANDSAEHGTGLNDERCNLHSWSEHGDWSACCYTSDHAQASCMWSKPAEIAGFQSDGYEISAWSTGYDSDPVAQWMGSAGHRSVMLNEGSWQTPFHAIGVGVAESDEHGRFTHVWFAHAPDCR